MEISRAVTALKDAPAAQLAELEARRSIVVHAQAEVERLIEAQPELAHDRRQSRAQPRVSSPARLVGEP
jgi:hypothetical protein